MIGREVMRVNGHRPDGTERRFRKREKARGTAGINSNKHPTMALSGPNGRFSILEFISSSRRDDSSIVTSLAWMLHEPCELAPIEMWSSLPTNNLSPIGLITGTFTNGRPCGIEISSACSRFDLFFRCRIPRVTRPISCFLQR